MQEKFVLPIPDDIYIWKQSDDADFKNDALSKLQLQVTGLLKPIIEVENPNTKKQLYLGKTETDPDEFFPLLIGTTSGKRMGYWYDNPNQLPGYFVSETEKNNVFKCIGRNMFDSLRLILEAQIDSDDLNPSILRESRSAQNEIRNWIVKFATENRYETGGEYVILYEYKASNVRARIITAETLNGIGIIMPSKNYLPDNFNVSGNDFTLDLKTTQLAFNAGLHGNVLKNIHDMRVLYAQETKHAHEFYALKSENYKALGYLLFS